MNIKCVALSLLFVATSMATKMKSEQIKEVLITTRYEDIEETFKKFEGKQGDRTLHSALTDMAMNEEYISKVARCLEAVEDPFPDEASRVSEFVHNAILYISKATLDKTEAFANMVASFKPSAVKPLATIRHWILKRKDAKNVLEQVMAKSPALIIDSLPKWLAWHEFDSISGSYGCYGFILKQAFEYLVPFATERDLSEAVIIAERNEHYMQESQVCCCSAENSHPSDLISRLKALLEFVKGRNALLKDSLVFWPTALIPIVEEYLVGDYLSVEAPGITVKPSTLAESEPCDQTSDAPATNVSPSNTGLDMSHDCTLSSQSEQQQAMAFMLVMMASMLNNSLTHEQSQL